MERRWLRQERIGESPIQQYSGETRFDRADSSNPITI